MVERSCATQPPFSRSTIASGDTCLIGSNLKISLVSSGGLLSTDRLSDVENSSYNNKFGIFCRVYRHNAVSVRLILKFPIPIKHRFIRIYILIIHWSKWISYPMHVVSARRKF